MNIKQSKNVHFTGIKGVGMTSVALCCKDLGIKVTGSDVAEEFVTDGVLLANLIVPKIGFSKENLDPKPDLLVYTGAHGGQNNPEVLAAQEMGIPTISHAEALGQLAEGKQTIAVCGVGGKTTTCAMLATILEYAGLKPSYAIGVGNIPSTGSPGKYNKEGKHFICEADEFAISPGVDNRPRWSYLKPEILVVTNIRYDHPDIYKTPKEFKKVFDDFTERVNARGGKVATNSKNLLPQDFKLNVPGDFNVENANNAYAVCDLIGIPQEKILEGLKKYTGCKRRFEKIGEVNGMLFYDDYAHHPEEIKATLKAAREWFPNRRIIALFQPHTYSRTKALFNEFVYSFDDADIVRIMDVFSSARETDTLGVSGKLLGDAVAKVHKDGGYIGSELEIIDYLKSEMKPGDVFITLGAGDVYKIHYKIHQQLLKEPTT